MSIIYDIAVLGRAILTSVFITQYVFMDLCFIQCIVSECCHYSF